MPRRFVQVLVLAVAVFLAAPSPAMAASGKQDFFLSVVGPGPVPPGRVFATGVVNSTGTAQQVSVQQNPNGSFSGTNIYSFPVGSVTVMFTGFPTSFTFDAFRCVNHFTAAGTFTLSGGSGRFTGATGGATFTSEGRSILTRTPSGCAPPTFEVTHVSDRGTINLP